MKLIDRKKIAVAKNKDALRRLNLTRRNFTRAQAEFSKTARKLENILMRLDGEKAAV